MDHGAAASAVVARAADAKRLGEARVAFIARRPTADEWKHDWPGRINAFVFAAPGPCWRFCSEYTVADFAAEIGFFIDVLGFGVNATDTGWIMLMAPEGEFSFNIAAAGPGRAATPTDGFKLSFMIADAPGVAADLVQRGVAFERPLAAVAPGQRMMSGLFRTPNGIAVELWGFPADG